MEWKIIIQINTHDFFFPNSKKNCFDFTSSKLFYNNNKKKAHIATLPQIDYIDFTGFFSPFFSLQVPTSCGQEELPSLLNGVLNPLHFSLQFLLFPPSFFGGLPLGFRRRSWNGSRNDRAHNQRLREGLSWVWGEREREKKKRGKDEMIFWLFSVCLGKRKRGRLSISWSIEVYVNGGQWSVLVESNRSGIADRGKTERWGFVLFFDWWLQVFFLFLLFRGQRFVPHEKRKISGLKRLSS